MPSCKRQARGVGCGGHKAGRNCRARKEAELGRESREGRGRPQRRRKVGAGPPALSRLTAGAQRGGAAGAAWPPGGRRPGRRGAHPTPLRTPPAARRCASEWEAMRRWKATQGEGRAVRRHGARPAQAGARRASATGRAHRTEAARCGARCHAPGAPARLFRPCRLVLPCATALRRPCRAPLQAGASSRRAGKRGTTGRQPRDFAGAWEGAHLKRPCVGHVRVTSEQYPCSSQPPSSSTIWPPGTTCRGGGRRPAAGGTWAAGHARRGPSKVLCPTAAGRRQVWKRQQAGTGQSAGWWGP